MARAARCTSCRRPPDRGCQGRHGYRPQLREGRPEREAHDKLEGGKGSRPLVMLRPAVSPERPGTGALCASPYPLLVSFLVLSLARWRERRDAPAAAALLAAKDGTCAARGEPRSSGRRPARPPASAAALRSAPRSAPLRAPLYLTLLAVSLAQAIGERGGESGEMYQLPPPSWLQAVCSRRCASVRASCSWSSQHARQAADAGRQRRVRHDAPLTCG